MLCWPADQRHATGRGMPVTAPQHSAIGVQATGLPLGADGRARALTSVATVFAHILHRYVHVRSSASAAGTVRTCDEKRHSTGLSPVACSRGGGAASRGLSSKLLRCRCAHACCRGRRGSSSPEPRPTVASWCSRAPTGNGVAAAPQHCTPHFTIIARRAPAGPPPLAAARASTCRGTASERGRA